VRTKASNQIIAALADEDIAATTIPVTSATRCSVDGTKGNSTPSTEGGQTGCLFLTSRHEVSVALIDWFEGKHGPLRVPLSVMDAEKEIIKLAKNLDPNLLNWRWA
jgi:hypothetical protein